MVAIKALKKTLGSLGHTVPFLSDMQKFEVEAWIKRFLTEEEQEEVYRLARETGKGKSNG